MKNIIRNERGFSSIPAIFIALGVIVIGTSVYFLTRPSTPNQQIFNNNSEQQPNEVTSENNKNSINTSQPNSSMGSLVVSNVQNKNPKTVSYGTKNVELLNFNLKADSTEDVELSGVAIEFYSTVYGEQLDRFALRNMRLVDEHGNTYSQSDGLNSFQEIAPDRSWGYTTTYVSFNGKSIIQKGTTKTFKLVVDVPADLLLPAIHATLPSWTGASESTFGKGISAHFKAIGLNSHEQPNITGDSNDVVYLKPQNNVGSIVISSEPSFRPVYPRFSKGVILSKINISAGNEEDVSVSKIAMRVSNFVPGQFKNVKLVRESGVQYGATIEHPLEVEANNPNLVFYDNELIKTSNNVVFNLIADVEIPAAEDSEYGTQLQREVVVYVLTPQNYSKWITTKGIASGGEVYVAGGVDTWLQFTN